MAYINFGRVLEFEAASAAAASKVAEKLHQQHGGAAWFVSAGTDSDTGGPYAYVVAKSGVNIPSLPDTISGVPIKIMLQETQPTELIIERTPYPYGYPYEMPMRYGFPRGGGHGGGHGGGGHHHGP